MARKITRFKRSVFVSIALLVALMLAVVSISYSWFQFQKPNKTYLYDINVESSYNLQMSDLTVWGDEITEDWHRNFRLKPITGDGTNFFVPIYETKEVVEGSGVYDAFPSQTDFTRIDTSVLPNYIYRLDFTLSIEGFVELYLDYAGNKTYVHPSYNHNGIFGFSPDNVCAAVRVAILHEGDIKCIWMPNSTTELVIDNDTRVLKEGACEEQYLFRHENDGAAVFEGNATIINTNQQPNGNYTDPQTGIVYIWGDITQENCPKIADLTPGSSNMNIMVWLEGTDRECDISMSAGRIDANICFAVTPITAK